MDGLSLVAEIRNDGHDLPILIVSGHVDDTLINRLLDYNVQIASKPVRFSNFFRLIGSMSEDHSAT